MPRHRAPAVPGLLLVSLLGLLLAALPSPAARAAGLLDPLSGVAPAPVTGPTAAELQAEVDRRAAALLDAQTDGASARAAATAALERFTVAQRAADSATVGLQQAEQQRRAAEQAVVDARAGLAAWAGSLYRTGAADPQVSLLDDLLGADDAQGLLLGLSSVQRATGGHGDALAAMRRAQAERAAATATARRAAQEATAAADEAARARALADAVVAESARRLVAAQQDLAGAQQAAAAQRERAEAAARRQQEQVAVVARLVAAGAGASCTLADITAFGNGLLPPAALCPLPFAPGHRLRADAAAALTRLSAAYAEAFGTPLCVTDSYRDLAAQVAVRAAKPHLAAVPGTSNHGWGVAVDLCDGVESFGTPQHGWLQEHALAFGWFHPAWAQQDGSKPEAWHWEYAG